jgi:hypothetical protein
MMTTIHILTSLTMLSVISHAVKQIDKPTPKPTQKPNLVKSTKNPFELDTVTLVPVGFKIIQEVSKSEREGEPKGTTWQMFHCQDSKGKDFMVTSYRKIFGDDTNHEFAKIHQSPAMLEKFQDNRHFMKFIGRTDLVTVTKPKHIVAGALVQVYVKTITFQTHDAFLKSEANKKHVFLELAYAYMNLHSKGLVIGQTFSTSPILIEPVVNGRVIITEFDWSTTIESCTIATDLSFMAQTVTQMYMMQAGVTKNFRGQVNCVPWVEEHMADGGVKRLLLDLMNDTLLTAADVVGMLEGDQPYPV